MNIKDHLTACFKSAPAAPFLFVGSGFSRRYLGLPDWKSLLQKFSNPEEFTFHLATASQDLPKVASLIAPEFHAAWWKEAKYAESRAEFSRHAKDISSALRYEICKYIHSLTASEISFIDGLAHEVEALKGLNVEGVITTNWDNLVETLYPDYKIFVGQDELLFSNPQSIGEIYKIHGSASDPQSLVLTDEDYQSFHKKNPYLASKLITLFVEHPIVFIGYSLADRNIRSLMHAITSVLSQDKLDKLSKNLIFVQRANGNDPSWARSQLVWDDGTLPITTVTTDDFLPVYEALDAVKRKIPVRILRYCKEQLYELVKNADTTNKMVVVDANTITKKEDVEFVIGVGVAAERASAKGYKAINAYDLFDDMLFSKNQYDAKCVVLDTVPILGRSSNYIPVFKYLRDVGINSYRDYKQAGYDLDKHIPYKLEHYRTSAYTDAFIRDAKGLSATEIISPP